MNYSAKRANIAACYCRLSRDDGQDGTSGSIETQRKVIEDYCKENRFTIYDFYCDDGFTGTNFERPAFNRMMDDIYTKKVDTVIVKDLSRLGRNHNGVEKYTEDVFLENGVRFIAIGDNYDSDNRSTDSEFVMPLKNIFNELYPLDCSRKTRQAFIAKAQNGEFIGSQAPYGYKKSPQDKHVLIIDDDTAPTVKWIFEMAAYQGYGYNKIALVLSDRKVITPAAYQAQRSGAVYDKNPYDWNLGTVRAMLNNTVYLGHLTSGKRRKRSFKSKVIINQPEEKWIVNKNMHEPLISEQLWNDAHERLDSRKRTSESGFVNIFAGLLKCDRCGYALGISNTSGKNNYYVCNTYKKKGKDACTIHYLLYDELYECVLRELQFMLKMVQSDSESFKKAVLAKLNVSGKKESVSINKEISELEKHIEKLDNRLGKIYDDRLDGVISTDEFRKFKEKFEAEKSAVGERLKHLQDKMTAQNDNISNVDLFTETVMSYLEIDSLDKEILNRLIDKIVVGDRVKIDGHYTQRIEIFYRYIGAVG